MNNNNWIDAFESFFKSRMPSTFEINKVEHRISIQRGETVVWLSGCRLFVAINGDYFWWRAVSEKQIEEYANIQRDVVRILPNNIWQKFCKIVLRINSSIDADDCGLKCCFFCLHCNKDNRISQWWLRDDNTCQMFILSVGFCIYSHSNYDDNSVCLYHKCRDDCKMYKVEIPLTFEQATALSNAVRDFVDEQVQIVIDDADDVKRNLALLMKSNDD